MPIGIPSKMQRQVQLGACCTHAGISKFSDGIARPSLEEMRSYENKLSVVPPLAEVATDSQRSSRSVEHL
jgi:hypothetical protein